MRELNVGELERSVANLIETSVSNLPDDYIWSLTRARTREKSGLARSILDRLLTNADYAASEGIPTCQDTGMAIIFIEKGQEVCFVGGSVGSALETGVRTGYANLRKSVVEDPLVRNNTTDNTPPIVHWEVVPGTHVKVTLMMKGFGAELMSDLRMMTPADGVEGVKRFVIDVVSRAGPNACPPVIVGVGVGGSFDSVALLSKKALLRPLGTVNPKEHLAALEANLLHEVDALDIGPQGFGGRVTALGVHIETAPTHIAALPVAVNLNCSAPRRATVTL